MSGIVRHQIIVTRLVFASYILSFVASILNARDSCVRGTVRMITKFASAEMMHNWFLSVIWELVEGVSVGVGVGWGVGRKRCLLEEWEDPWITGICSPGGVAPFYEQKAFDWCVANSSGLNQTPVGRLRCCKHLLEREREKKKLMGVTTKQWRLVCDCHYSISSSWEDSTGGQSWWFIGILTPSAEGAYLLIFMFFSVSKHFVPPTYPAQRSLKGKGCTAACKGWERELDRCLGLFSGD